MSYQLPFLVSRRLQSVANRMSSWSVADRVRNDKPSIWVEFVTLAMENKAVNLGQGFPDGPMPTFVANLLKNIAEHPERTDFHQYTRGFGHPRLVSVLSKLYGHLYNRSIVANEEVLVTVGAYLALYYAFHGWLNKGDEVMIIEPAYDCYVPQVSLAGGVPVPVCMKLGDKARSSADFMIDMNELEAKCTDKTKMLIINNPNNPVGKLYSRAELEALADFAKRKNLLVIADEVYEWHVWDQGMVRFASLPGMYERTISIGSAGKAFSITGWKLGWAVGPKELLAPLKTIHQNCVFTCSTPTQEAVAQAFEIELPLVMNGDVSKSYLLNGLPQELKSKRDKLAKMLQEAGFDPIIPQAGYFLLAAFDKLDGPFRAEKPGDDPLDFRFVRWLCKEKKLAAIPPSAFYSGAYKKGNDHHIRLCYMKKDETLEAARDILKKI